MLYISMDGKEQKRIKVDKNGWKCDERWMGIAERMVNWILLQTMRDLCLLFNATRLRHVRTIKKWLWILLSTWSHHPNESHTLFSFQGNIMRSLNFNIVVAIIFGVTAGNILHFDSFHVPLCGISMSSRPFHVFLPFNELKEKKFLCQEVALYGELFTFPSICNSHEYIS